MQPGTSALGPKGSPIEALARQRAGGVCANHWRPLVASWDLHSEPGAWLEFPKLGRLPYPLSAIVLKWVGAEECGL